MEMFSGKRYLAVPRYPTKMLKTVCGCLCDVVPTCALLRASKNTVDNAVRKLVSFVVTGARFIN